MVRRRQYALIHSEEKDLIPPVLTALLACRGPQNCGSIQFPLPAVHHFRESLTERDSAGAHILCGVFGQVSIHQLLRVVLSCEVLELSLCEGWEELEEVIPDQRAPGGWYLMLM